MKVPFRNSFEKSDFFGEISRWSLILSFLLTLSLLFLTEPKLAIVSKVVNITNSIAIVIYLITSFTKEYFIFKGNLDKRYDLIDNSYGTEIGDSHSEGYFSNDKIPYGIYKVFVNSYENSFFSKNIVEKMLPGKFVKAAIIIITYLLVPIFADSNVWVLFIRLTLPAKMLIDSIRFGILYSKLCLNQKNFRTSFTSMPKESKEQIANLLSSTIQYESIIAWANTSLSSKIYNKFNDRLSKEWEDLKTELKINRE